VYTAPQALFDSSDDLDTHTQTYRQTDRQTYTHRHTDTQTHTHSGCEEVEHCTSQPC